MSNSSSSSGGIGFCGLLTVLFIALKLTNYINWSWWWVLAPIWIPTVIVVVVLIILGIIWLWAEGFFGGLGKGIKEFKDKILKDKDEDQRRN